MTAHPPVRGLYAILNLPYPASLSAQDCVAAMVAGGVSWVQLRAKTWSSKQRHELCVPLREQCRQAQVGFVVNDDLATAIAVQADGVHVGQEDLQADPGLLKRARDAGVGVGLSTHTLEQFVAAQSQDLAYVAIGPIFGTQSKENPEASVGVETLRRCMEQARKPVVAIGGITPERAQALYGLGVHSVAVISAIQGSRAGEIEQRCRAFEPPGSLR